MSKIADGTAVMFTGDMGDDAPPYWFVECGECGVLKEDKGPNSGPIQVLTLDEAKALVLDHHEKVHGEAR